ncbi:hypothetical protein NQ318_002638 [Aromia moschata]|uniref:Transposase n=1 Tax=Aromia moschata TaxID=1265417 RepID=A0AAV8Y8V2_9CUCU|nr:hypothetical protein NQ318_002638 [Aromia moschata]
MEFESKVKNKVLSCQSREILSLVLQFMQSEARNGEPVIPLNKVQERVSAATGVSLSTVKRIRREATRIKENIQASFVTHNKKRCTKSSLTLDDFDKGLLRRTIINFHVTEKQVPTLPRIYNKFRESIDYQGCQDTLRKEVKLLGFRWKKFETNRKLLIEKPDIRHQRISFLRQMKQYRQEGRPIIYMDETYIHASHTSKTTWVDNSIDGITKPIAKGSRLIILNAGGEDGFIPNAYVRWKSTCNTGDYHNEMNYENYEKWLKEKLVPNMPPKKTEEAENLVTSARCSTSAEKVYQCLLKKLILVRLTLN